MSRPEAAQSPPPVEPTTNGQPLGPWRAVMASVIVLLVAAAYANTWNVPFIFDDLTAIQENQSIRDLSRPGIVLHPPTGTGDTIEGRPVLNLSFALNYALSGLRVPSYHGFNIAIHALNALLLFGLVRRTRAHLAGQDSQQGILLAGAIALIWALHPLNTSAVTYLSRRADSLAALFFLLTLYAFIHGGLPGRTNDAAMVRRRRLWFCLAVIACLLGVATKETVAVAPLVVFLYDRTFLAGSWRGAWQQRRPVHFALGTTWVVLAVLILLSPNRGGTAGFGTGTSSWHYLLTQFEAVVRYLGLVVWPHPLVFDYGRHLVTAVTGVWLEALLVVVLSLLVLMALRVRPVLGFLGASFFLCLAPGSSFIPVATQTIAEHRMYLPLIPVVILFVLALLRAHPAVALAVLIPVALAEGGLTLARNGDYRTEVTIWSDTVAKRPGNPRAHNNLGSALIRAGRPDEALPHFEAAVELDPGSAESQSNLATALAQQGRIDEALEHFTTAAALGPGVAAIRYGHGMVLLRAGRIDAGAAALREALALDPTNAEIPFQLANALSAAGPNPEARAWYERALELNPAHSGAHNGLALLIAQTGELQNALPHFEAALAARPDYPEAHANLGNALLRLGRANEAIPHFEAALQLRPDMRGVREALEYAQRIR